MVEILAIRRRQCSAVPSALRPGSDLAHQLAARAPLVVSLGFFFGTSDVRSRHRIHTDWHRDGAWISGHNSKYEFLELAILNLSMVGHGWRIAAIRPAETADAERSSPKEPNAKLCLCYRQHDSARWCSSLRRVLVWPGR